MKIYPLLGLGLSLFGCCGYANNNIEGYYSLLDKGACEKALNIELKQGRFAIYIDESKKKVLDKGKFDIIKDDDRIYLKMNKVEGKYKS